MVSLTIHQARIVFVPPQRPYELHRDLCRAFGGPREGAYLFRTEIDRSEPPAKRIVLVQSAETADWEKLAGKLAACETHSRTWEIAAGRRFRFFLRANATVAKKATHTELAPLQGEAFRAVRGKRVAIRGETELITWLNRQGERHGFRLHHTDFRQEDGTMMPIPAVRVATGRDVEWRDKGKAGTHAGVDFEGLLDVEQPEAFANAVRAGIGPGKAFGFGLLSIAGGE